MPRIVVLAPYAKRSGGPEACHQLVDCLIRLGFSAELWLLNESEVEQLVQAREQGMEFRNANVQAQARVSPVEEYQQYQCPAFHASKVGDDVIFVLPELYLLLLPLFRGMPCMVWWLSVDNALISMGYMNLNHLRQPTVTHLVQSAYAARFVAALGLKSQYLSDYTVVSREIVPALAERPTSVALVGGSKVLLDLTELERILRLDQGIDVRVIHGMSRSEVYGCMRNARVLADFGKFPGKDRMVREALLLGCLVATGSDGAALGEDDFSLPSIYRQPAHDLSKVAALLSHMVKYPEHHQAAQRAAVQRIEGEYAQFTQEVLSVFAATLNGSGCT